MITVCIVLVIALCIPVTACAQKQKEGVKSKFNYDPNTLSVSLASEPQSIDPALTSTSDGATLVMHCFSGLAHWEKDANGNFEMLPDSAESLPEPVANSNGTFTYTYKIKDKAKWSDGKDLTSHDFIFA